MIRTIAMCVPWWGMNGCDLRILPCAGCALIPNYKMVIKKDINRQFSKEEIYFYYSVSTKKIQPHW